MEEFIYFSNSTQIVNKSQQIRILHKTNKKTIFSELLAFWKVCPFTVYTVLSVNEYTPFEK